MFRKGVLTNKLKQLNISIWLLLTVLIYGRAVSVSGSEKPNLSEPLKKCWAYGGENGLSKIIASDNESNIILTIDNYSIISLNPNSKLENWKAASGGKLESDAIVDGNNLFYITYFENEDRQKTYTLNSISLKTGLTNWQIKLKSYSEINLKQSDNKDLLFITTGDNSLSAIKKSNGERIWTKEFSGLFVSIEASSKTDGLNILLDDRLLKVSAKNGEAFKENKLKKNRISSSIVKENYLLLGYTTGELTKINTENNKSETDWKIKTGAGISGLVEYRDEVLTTSLDNFIYLFSNDNGKLKWKKRVAGRINIEPQIFGTFAAVINSGDNSTTVVDLRDGKSINQIQLEQNNFFSGRSLLTDTYFILQTSRGIYFFVNTDAVCK